MSAWTELLEFVDEPVEKVVFGHWGWDSEFDKEFSDDPMPMIPLCLRGKVITLEEAEPYMQNWEFDGYFGRPDCYQFYAWTKSHVVFVVQYDGATGLTKVPRNPTEGIPIMPGG